MHEFAQAASVLKFYNSRYFGKERIVAADAHVQTRLELGSPLPDDNCPPIDQLACKTLYPKSLGLAISAIPGASHSLFVCHTDLLAFYIDLFNADFGLLLTMPACAAILFFLFVFEDQDLVVFSLRLQNTKH